MIDLNTAGPQKDNMHTWDWGYHTGNNMDPVGALLAKMAEEGLTPAQIIPDGNLHRFDVEKPNDKAGWYIYFPGDIAAGAFGNWKTGQKEKWCSRSFSALSPKDQKEYEKKQKQAKEKRQQVEAENHARAEKEVLNFLHNTSPCPPDYQYLKDKGIQPHGVLTDGKDIIVPIYVGGQIKSLQRIKTDGTKKFHPGGKIKGGCYPIGNFEGATTILLTEGLATASTLNEATGYPVVVAFNAGNLPDVARFLKTQHPDQEIIVCADDDWKTDGNPGVTKARTAAEIVHGRMVKPVFSVKRPDKATDFNDLAALEGIESVKECFSNIASMERQSLSDGLLSFADLLALEIEPKSYHLSPAFPTASYGLISGERGLGKTHFVTAVSIAIATNGTFGPWECKEPAKVLIIDGELALSDLKERVRACRVPAADATHNLFVLPNAYICEKLKLPSLNLCNEETRVSLRDMILKSGAKVVFFDNVASLTPGIDENSKTEWDPINQWFIGMRFAGVSCWLIHHLGKSGEQRGTSGREDNIDVSIKLQKPSDYTTTDGARFILKFTKKRIESTLLPLLDDIECHYKPNEQGVYEWTFQRQKKNIELEILNLLSFGDTQKEIAEKLSISQSAVSKTKTKLIEKGLLDSYGMLTEKGEDELKKGGIF